MDLSFLDAREQNEVKFNLVYFQQFNHGTNSHLERVIIAKLAVQLERLEQHIRTMEHAEENYMD